LGSNDAEEREKENEDGQFEHQAKTEKDKKNQIEILVDINQGDDGALETDQEAQDVGQRNKIAKGDAGQEKEDGGKEETGDGTALVLVKRRSNELPDLKEHPRGGDDNSDVNAAGDEQGHVARGV